MFNIATMMGEAGRGQDEIHWLRKCIATDPTNQICAGAYANLGCALGDLQRADLLEEEMACYEKAIELNPKLKVAWYSYACACAENGRLKEAEAKFKHILTSIEPGDARTADSLARVHGMMRRRGIEVEEEPKQAEEEVEDF